MVWSPWPSSPRPSYKCSSKASLGPNCRGSSMSTRILDPAVWARVESLLLRPETIRAELTRLEQAYPTAADLATVDGALTTVARRQANVAKAIRSGRRRGSRPAAPGATGGAESAEKQLTAERESVAVRRDSWLSAQADLRVIEAWCRDLGAQLAGSGYDERRLTLTALAVQVTLYPADHEPRYVVTASVPVDNPIELGPTCRCSRSPRKSSSAACSSAASWLPRWWSGERRAAG